METDLFLRVILWSVYLVSLYFVIFWFLVFLDRDSSAPVSKKLRKYPFVTVVVPCLNEEKYLAATVESALTLRYPRNKYEVLIIDNGSTDRTAEVAQELVKKHSGFDLQFVKLTKRGKGVALNEGIARARGEFFVCLDVDSFVDEDALLKILPHFDEDENLGAVLPCMKVYQPKTWLQKVQYCEYTINMYYKWLMSNINCVHVAPGPFSVYKTQVLKDIGGFHEKALTEDLEITYRMQAHHHVIKQLLDTYVYTMVPATLKEWYKQRNRWFKGTMHTTWDYRRLLFNKEYGDFGMIQLPMVFISGVLSVIMFSLSAFYFFKPHVEYVVDLSYVGFDVLTFLKHFGFSFHVLDINFATIATSLFMLALSVLFMWKAAEATKGSTFAHGYKNVFVFMFLYFLFLGIVWIGVSVDLLRGVVQEW